jgi:hypothetical protein
MLKRVVASIVVLVAALISGAVSASACDPVDPLTFKEAGVSYFLASPLSQPSRENGTILASLTGGRTDSETLKPGTVVLVPWNYGPDCRPFPWNSATPWTPPNQMAFYTGTLRPRTAWIDNYPTFDLFKAVFQPLWLGDDDRRGGGVYPKPYLTVQQYMDFYAVLPTDQELQDAKPAVSARMEAWVSRNPTLAGRYPANSALSSLRRALTNK